MKKVIMIIGLMVLAMNVYAASYIRIGLNDVIEAMEEPFRKNTPGSRAIHSAEGDFFQQVKGVHGEVERATGNVTLAYERRSGSRRPTGLYRWEFEEPQRLEFAFDGETRTAFDQGANQFSIVTVRDSYHRDEINYDNLMESLGYLSEDFLVRYAYPNQDPEGNYVLELSPRKSLPSVSRLYIVVSKDSVVSHVQGGPAGEFPVLAVATHHHDGSVKTIEFAEMDINTHVSSFDFEIIQPAGVEVIREEEFDLGETKVRYKSGPQW